MKMMADIKYQNNTNVQVEINMFTPVFYFCKQLLKGRCIVYITVNKRIYKNKPKNFWLAYFMIYNYIENLYNRKRMHRYIPSIGYLLQYDFELSIIQYI